MILEALDGLFQQRDHEPFFPFANVLLMSLFEPDHVRWLN
jgi:hypothetical protein